MSVDASHANRWGRFIVQSTHRDTSASRLTRSTCRLFRNGVSRQAFNVHSCVREFQNADYVRSNQKHVDTADSEWLWPQKCFKCHSNFILSHLRRFQLKSRLPLYVPVIPTYYFKAWTQQIRAHTNNTEKNNNLQTNFWCELATRRR